MGKGQCYSPKNVCDYRWRREASEGYVFASICLSNSGGRCDTKCIMGQVTRSKVGGGGGQPPPLDRTHPTSWTGPTTTPWTGLTTPTGHYHHPSPGQDTSPSWIGPPTTPWTTLSPHTPHTGTSINVRTVRILLGCILV